MRTKITVILSIVTFSLLSSSVGAQMNTAFRCEKVVNEMKSVVKNLCSKGASKKFCSETMGQLNRVDINQCTEQDVKAWKMYLNQFHAYEKALKKSMKGKS